MVAKGRTLTGIEGFDQLLGGGIPTGHTVLLAGGPGTGKTTFALEFLAHGAAVAEKGVFLAVTQPLTSLRRDASRYAFLRPELLGDAVRLLDVPTLLGKSSPHEVATGPAVGDGPALIDALGRMLRETGATRLVIDSVTAILHQLGGKPEIRDFLFRLSSTLAAAGCTTLLASETPPREHKYGIFGVEEFVADGIVFLGELERNNDVVRTLQVVKMRGIEHSRARFLVDISEYGVGLAPLLNKFEATVTP